MQHFIQDSDGPWSPKNTQDNLMKNYIIFVLLFFGRSHRKNTEQKTNDNIVSNIGGI